MSAPLTTEQVEEILALLNKATFAGIKRAVELPVADMRSLATELLAYEAAKGGDVGVKPQKDNDDGAAGKITGWAVVGADDLSGGILWECHDEADKGDTESLEKIELAADRFPIGTKVVITEPALTAAEAERDEAMRVAENNADLWREACKIADEHRAENEKMREALTEISSPTQTLGLLWWQILARRTLASLSNTSEGGKE